VRENVRLRLSYRRDGQDRYIVTVQDQDEGLRSLGRLYTCANGWHLFSECCPELSTYGRKLYIRGDLREEDDRVLVAKTVVLERIAELVASFNKRKNVCRLGESGTVV